MINNAQARIKETHTRSLTTTRLTACMLRDAAQREDRQTPSRLSDKMESIWLTTFLFVALYFASQKAQIPDCWVQKQTWKPKGKSCSFRSGSP